MHQVAVTGQREALWFLVKDLKVDINQRVADTQFTALHYAAKVRSTKLSTFSVHNGYFALHYIATNAAHIESRKFTSKL